jgi:hypothetical protein
MDSTQQTDATLAAAMHAALLPELCDRVLLLKHQQLYDKFLHDILCEREVKGPWRTTRTHNPHCTRVRAVLTRAKYQLNKFNCSFNTSFPGYPLRRMSFYAVVLTCLKVPMDIIAANHVPSDNAGDWVNVDWLVDELHSQLGGSYTRKHCVTIVFLAAGILGYRIAHDYVEGITTLSLQARRVRMR